jgi:hypothetical protein
MVGSGTIEMVLAGVIIGAVSAAAAVTGFRDWRRRRAERTESPAPAFGEPIPSGWTTGADRGGGSDGGGR